MYLELIIWTTIPRTETFSQTPMNTYTIGKQNAYLINHLVDRLSSIYQEREQYKRPVFIVDWLSNGGVNQSDIASWRWQCGGAGADDAMSLIHSTLHNSGGIDSKQLVYTGIVKI